MPVVRIPCMHDLFLLTCPACGCRPAGRGGCSASVALTGESEKHRVVPAEPCSIPFTGDAPWRQGR